MTIEEAVRAWLTADPAVQALIGVPPKARYYPEEAPQEDLTNTDPGRPGAYPHIVALLVSYPQNAYLAGVSGLPYPRLQLSCWAKGPTGKAQVVQLAETVRKSNGGIPGGRPFNGFSGPMGDLNVQLVSLEDRRASTEPDPAGSEFPLRRIDLDFKIIFIEN